MCTGSFGDGTMKPFHPWCLWKYISCELEYFLLLCVAFRLMKLQTVQYGCFLPTLLDLSCGGQGRGEIRLCGKNRVRRPSVGLAQYLCCVVGFFVLILFIWVIITLFCSFFFSPLKVGCLSCPMRDCLLIGWFCFFSNLHDLQLWRGFQSCDLQYSVSWRKSSLLCHHFHQRTWRSWYWKGLFLRLRYSLVFGEYCLPVFLSPEFEKALSVCFQKAF